MISELKIQHVLTLTYLLSKGARYNYVQVTTSSLGKEIKKSQQAASKHLLELEEGGFIERIISGRTLSVKITQRGYSEMMKLYSVLRSSLDSFPSSIILRGYPVSGMGEGAYYMSLKGYTAQFKEKIGYTPYPGTLNVKLEKKEYSTAVKQLEFISGILIEGFSDEKRTYGWVKCYKALLNSSHACHLIRLERTHHDTSIVELISKTNLREAAGLKDNSQVTIEVSTNSLDKNTKHTP